MLVFTALAPSMTLSAQITKLTVLVQVIWSNCLNQICILDSKFEGMSRLLIVANCPLLHLFFYLPPLGSWFTPAVLQSPHKQYDRIKGLHSQISVFFFLITKEDPFPFSFWDMFPSQLLTTRTVLGEGRAHPACR